MLSDDKKDRIGSLIGERYRILSSLGSGGMGEVFLAEDMKLPGKKWAIKVIGETPWAGADFEAEARLLSRLNHPYLPKIVDWVEGDSTNAAYLVMEFIHGETLQEVFLRKALPEDQIVRYAAQLCEVFDYLHGLQPSPVIYRDLKPTNVMIDEQDNIRLIDFGIARSFAADRLADTVPLGTVGFAAPEQFENRQSDEKTDLYSLGALLYYLLSGGRFYRPGSGRDSNPRLTCSANLEAIVLRLLRRDSDERYASSAAVKVELDQLIRFKPGPKKRTSEASIFARKLMVVGSVYPGAGATHFVMQAAGALRLHRIPHAVVEYRTDDPEYYSLLFGDKKAPACCRFLQDCFDENNEGRTLQAWMDRGTEWVPADPERSGGKWHPETVFKLLQTIKQPIVIVDVSDRWLEPAVIKLCSEADLLVPVAGPSPSRLNSLHAAAIFEKLLSWKEAGKAIGLAVNRMTGFSGQGEWIRSLPMKPVCFLDEIPYRDLLERQWKGNPVPAETTVRERAHEAVSPILDTLLPTEWRRSQRSNSFPSVRWLKRFFTE